ncbi:MAG: DUF1045 domain-containing protein [Alphaproteobacteria bacterium]|jgi:hypothetical protein|nr:DUF1045 domain-containing protein [Alphaproteobacteria bacterium]
MTGQSHARWAVYFVPEPDELLGNLGQAWFAAHDRTPYLASPRRYGFHATLKAPFHLREDATADGLRLGARRLTRRLDPVTLPGLQVVAMGRYLALMPNRPCPAVGALAERLVVGFDRFRAPRRRHWIGLTPRQRHNARQWGYPWIGRDYRFHMTLAGPFAAAPDAAWLARAQRHFVPLAGQSVTIDAISLCRQPSAGVPFSESTRLPLGGGLRKGGSHSVI